MKAYLAAAATSLLFIAGTANAISVNVQAGRHFTNTSAAIGDNGAGLSFNGNWARSDHNGQLGSLGTAFSLPVGPLTASIGGKVLYLSPKDGKKGEALAGGVGLSWAVMPSLSLYSEVYGAPSSLTSGIDSYTEATGGLRFTVFKPLTVDAGYRVMNMRGKEGHRDNKLADGFYVGAGLNF
ncbi:porin [Photorhabdus temperata]|uniref:YfaZ n=2 Tax=Photorhabdus khanii TaxID=1004150 RepID=W3V650_9GAMM|nr:YfaZ family outer membrane protein [Photorhabdus khanii]ETS31278.1 YfaZ precursor [Photorhabdus khanii NC19]MQL46593.1 porin [Photorhabdus khanii]OHV49924.1 porin [Photorhabdus temperata]